jgi:hypothetical protein
MSAAGKLEERRCAHMWDDCSGALSHIRKHFGQSVVEMRSQKAHYL